MSLKVGLVLLTSLVDIQMYSTNWNVLVLSTGYFTNSLGVLVKLRLILLTVWVALKVHAHAYFYGRLSISVFNST